MKFKPKNIEELTQLIWDNSKLGMTPLSFYEARTAAEAIMPAYKEATELVATYRDRLDRIDEKALESGLNGTHSAITQIHYLASR